MEVCKTGTIHTFRNGGKECCEISVQLLREKQMRFAFKGMARQQHSKSKRPGVTRKESLRAKLRDKLSHFF
ncbi:hypothetical protein CDAR_484511 [Caerostris darwini]|uniref:Uncharacterized protein n=1 Tax=Caerostris darwini TaxID=1538125 RepID=A0AAV4MKC5_9ARAC|nr:hypothetical protein CDAR_484511 [Caerostris darwini]